MWETKTRADGHAVGIHVAIISANGGRHIRASTEMPWRARAADWAGGAARWRGSGDDSPEAYRSRVTSPWLGDGRGQWLEEVSAWLVGVVSSLRLGSLVEIASVRERPWGAVLRVRTSHRVVYFKAEGLGAHHEPQILAELAPDWPDLVPKVLEAEGSRSWLVMADHGQPMWDMLDTAGQVAAFERLLPRYAELQASSARSVGVWIEAGAPDRRVHRLPGLLHALLAGETAAGSLPFEAEQRRAVDAVCADFGRVCEELADTPFAAALDHGDLHGGNVLVDRGDLRLADWGDSCVTHPFASLYVTYELAVSRFGPADRAAAGRRLRDAYLDSWRDDGSLGTLHETFTLALWAGYVSRALEFAQMLEGATETLIDRWQGYIVVVLRHWQEAHGRLNDGEEFLAAIEP